MGTDVEKNASRPAQAQRRKLLGHLLLFVFIFAAFFRLVPNRSSFLEYYHGQLEAFAPTPKDTIKWDQCGKGFECTSIQAPLDYHNTTSGNVTLAVARYLATSKDRLGSIFVNPGGPGGSGVGFVLGAGAVLSEIFDGRYDIVSWDPRGINNSSPRVECFPNKQSHDIFLLEHQAGLQIGNLSTKAGQEHLRLQLQNRYAESELISGLCEQYSGEILRHVGTATVVRDLEFIASTMEGKGKPINYAGFSYGTIVGSYFVNMFPDRVGRVLIDGVVDPSLWATRPGYFWGPKIYEDADKAYENFLLSCVTAGPERCALAINTTSVSQLRRRIQVTIDDLLIQPLSVPHAARPGLLSAFDVRVTIFGALYSPRTWTKLADKIAALFAGDGAPILSDIQSMLNLSDINSPQRTTYALNAVSCTDWPPLWGKSTTTEGIEILLDAAVDTYETTTALFAGIHLDPTCLTWRAEETERYTGPWNSSLANTILVIGNTADPVCPVSNAKAVNSYLSDSRLVIQDGPGHCSLAQTSLCTGKILREYFIDGKLPENGKVCPVTEITFPPKPPVENGTDATATLSMWNLVTDEGESLSKDDLALLEKLKAFGEAAQPEMITFGRL